MTDADVVVHQRPGAGEVFLERVMLYAVLIRPGAVEGGVSLQTHLVADHQVCPVSEEDVGGAGLRVGGDLVGGGIGDAQEPAGVHLITVDVVAGGGLQVHQVALGEGVERPAEVQVVHVLAQDEGLDVDREIRGDLAGGISVLRIHLGGIDDLNARGVGDAGGLELAALAVQAAPVKTQLHPPGQVGRENLVRAVLGAHDKLTGLGHDGLQALGAQTQVAEGGLGGLDLPSLTAPGRAGTGGHAGDVDVAGLQGDGAGAQFLDNGLVVEQPDDLIQVDFGNQEAARCGIGRRQSLELPGHVAIVILLAGIVGRPLGVIPAEDIQALDGANQLHHGRNLLLLPALLRGRARQEDAGVLTLYRGRLGSRLGLPGRRSGLTALGALILCRVALLGLVPRAFVLLALAVGIVIGFALIFRGAVRRRIAGAIIRQPFFDSGLNQLLQLIGVAGAVIIRRSALLGLLNSGLYNFLQLVGAHAHGLAGGRAGCVVLRTHMYLLG